MTIKEPLLATAMLMLCALIPTRAYAGCYLVEPPVMQFSYDYQRDRSIGSTVPIATVSFDSVLECEPSSDGTSFDLIMDNAKGWQSKVSPYQGRVMMLPEYRDSVGLVWHNSVENDETKVDLERGQPFSRKISSGRVRVNDRFDFYYVAAGILPGMDISPGNITINYSDGKKTDGLYELNFPAIPLHALSCSVDSENLNVSFGKVNEENIGDISQEPLDAVIRRIDWSIQCDPGTNVGLRVNTAKSYLNNVVVAHDVLDGDADGIGVKMRYLSMERAKQDIQFGQTMPWGKTPDSQYKAKQSVFIPLEFYLVKTKNNTTPGKLQASATIELRHE